MLTNHTRHIQSGPGRSNQPPPPQPVLAPT